jgi:hypothetical protein
MTLLVTCCSNRLDGNVGALRQVWRYYYGTSHVVFKLHFLYKEYLNG